MIMSDRFMHHWASLGKAILLRNVAYIHALVVRFGLLVCLFCVTDLIIYPYSLGLCYWH